ncbi:MAG: ureidoglycolate lyase [Pseudomonadota bacterium]
MKITPQPLTYRAFRPFGDVLDCSGQPDKIINQGMCGRFHDRARLDFGPDGRAGVSLFKAEPRSLPLAIDMVERHPEGSQCFVPMTLAPFLVVVCGDDGGTPTAPQAFLTEPGQAVNFHRGTWHGVLMPLSAPGLFAVIDRIGDTPNLQEHWFDAPVTVTRPTT